LFCNHELNTGINQVLPSLSQQKPFDILLAQPNTLKPISEKPIKTKQMQQTYDDLARYEIRTALAIDDYFKIHQIIPSPNEIDSIISNEHLLGASLKLSAHSWEFITRTLVDSEKMSPFTTGTDAEKCCVVAAVATVKKLLEKGRALTNHEIRSALSEGDSGIFILGFPENKDGAIEEEVERMK
jgi:hypothetical protein